MVAKLRERPGWPAYKVKVADPGDLSSLRASTPARRSMWTATAPGSRPAPDRLWRRYTPSDPRDRWQEAGGAESGQPISGDRGREHGGSEDLELCARAFHGVNVKPMKVGGITPALAILRRVRQRGLITMVGCVMESAASVSATAHLGGLADYLDADMLDLLAVDNGAGAELGAGARYGCPAVPAPGTGPTWTPGDGVGPVLRGAARRPRHRPRHGPPRAAPGSACPAEPTRCCLADPGSRRHRWRDPQRGGKSGTAALRAYPRCPRRGRQGVVQLTAAQGRPLSGGRLGAGPRGSRQGRGLPAWTGRRFR
jgi:hypothetical protein